LVFYAISGPGSIPDGVTGKRARASVNDDERRGRVSIAFKRVC
jgi:hypothetical protein